MPPLDFLFLSNGYGEDTIAAGIAKRIPGNYEVGAFPLVGEGKTYAAQGIRVLESFPPLPAAGVSLSQDLQGGLLSLIRKQWSALRKLRDQTVFAVAVGDVFPAFMAHFALRRKFIFIGTAKSARVQPYNFFERWILRKAERVFVRDNDTAFNLGEKKVNSCFAGNPMMDEAFETKTPFQPFDGLTVAILPGSRNDAPQNLGIQVEALQALQRKMGKKIRGLVLVPPTLEIDHFVSRLDGWDGMTVHESGEILGSYGQGDVSLLFATGCLGDVLAASAVVLGQAGTANEQAAGWGLPVVAFDYQLSRNGKLSWYRWRQKKLLGEALSVVRVDIDKIANEAFRIIRDQNLYENLSRKGKERMGPGGGTRKMAEFLATLKRTT